MSLYTPQPEDIEWAKQMVALAADGGIMQFPPHKGAHVYQFDHQKKTLTLLNQEVLLEFQPGFVIHQKTVNTFAAVGYKVLPETEG